MAHHLGCGSGFHAAQTAAVMRGFERVLLGGQPGDRPPDLVLVVGDVDSTLAAALVCARLHVPVGHVEAGLRSRDPAMPEEINRVLARRSLRPTVPLHPAPPRALGRQGGGEDRRRDRRVVRLAPGRRGAKFDGHRACT